jgi:hypothetical protein
MEIVVMSKYKLNRDKLDRLQELLLDLQDDADSVTAEYGIYDDPSYRIKSVLSFVIDQMNRVAGHKLVAEQREQNEDQG